MPQNSEYRHTLFQFQSGAVKSQPIVVSEVTKVGFKFQIGAVKIS